MSYVETCEPSAWPVLAEFGPAYPALPIAKHRRMKDPDADQRRVHGEAVCEAIRALQRRELQRELPSHKAPCASGTWETHGAKINAAIRRQHAARLQADANADRARRTDDEIRKAYAAAMAERRAQEAAALVSVREEDALRADAAALAASCDHEDRVAEVEIEIAAIQAEPVEDHARSPSVGAVGTCVVAPGKGRIGPDYAGPTFTVVANSHTGRKRLLFIVSELGGNLDRDQWKDTRAAFPLGALAAVESMQLRGLRIIGLPRKTRSKPVESVPSVPVVERPPETPEPSCALPEAACTNPPAKPGVRVKAWSKPRYRVKAGSRPSTWEPDPGVGASRVEAAPPPERTDPSHAGEQPSLAEFITARVGPHWSVHQRITSRVRQRRMNPIRHSVYLSLTAEYDRSGSRYEPYCGGAPRPRLRIVGGTDYRRAA